MCENRRPGTGWVVGGERLGSKFGQNRVGESDRAIREQLVQHKTRDQVVFCERVIGERAVRVRAIGE